MENDKLKQQINQLLVEKNSDFVELSSNKKVTSFNTVGKGLRDNNINDLIGKATLTTTEQQSKSINVNLDALN